MPAVAQLLTQRITRVGNQVRDRREVPGTLTVLRRTAITPASDAEIIALITRNTFAAAVIPDDAAAPVYGGDKIDLEVNHLANVKHGKAFTQEALNILARLAADRAGEGDDNYFTDWIGRTTEDCINGVEQRMEHLLIGAMLDTVSYNKHGTVFTVTFGTPSDLKVTKSGTGLWSAPTTATPIADIQTQQALGREKYGIEYDRITMNSATFREMIATTEFRELATLYSQVVLPGTNRFPTSDVTLMSAIAGRMIGADLELRDDQYVDQNADGTITRTKFVPNDKVILSSKALDNNREGIDWGNGQVTESIVQGLTGQAVYGTIADRGPTTYATSPTDLNPPNLTMWGVCRGFPRKFNKAATSVLTV